MQKTFSIISLGCAKNTVDSRSMAELLVQAGYSELEEPDKADFVIVNTCGFIQPASQESLQTLQELAQNKPQNQHLIAAGCLSEREKRALSKQVSGVDAFLGTRRWMDILQVFCKLEEKPLSPYYHFPNSAAVGRDPQGVPRSAVQGASAYLKIADGCDHPCAFCAIPLIKGPMRSRKLNEILMEVRTLQNLHVKELNLIAQDTSAYGRDLGLQDGLVQLLEAIVQSAPEIPWLRILYTFPGEINQRLLDCMANHAQILPYLDMPLQHAHPQVLQRMRRPADMAWVKHTISDLRQAMPGIALRTTFIVGFPGESEHEFQALLDFTREMQFDRLGIFPYYHEKGTGAFALKDDVPERVKEERAQRLAGLQEEISLAKNRQWLGKQLQVLVEGSNEGVSVGRSYRDAPEIDGLVIIRQELPIGEMVQVTITEALVHDLVGKKENPIEK